MSENIIKETMDQIHISEEMQEEIIMNVKKKMESKKSGKRNWKKTAASAAAAVLAVGVIGISANAMIKSIVRERMENIPKEEVQFIENMIQEQNVEADVFTREYSDSENKRMKQLAQDYQNGVFPEKELVQVDDETEIVEGTLCYVKTKGTFYLPDRELTDEEILEIIDFNHVRSYAVEQTSAAQEAREEYLAEKNRMAAIVSEAGGSSEDEAVKIAKKQMETDLGEKAQEMEILTDIYGKEAFLIDISSNAAEYDTESSVAYSVGFRNEDRYIYACIIDAVDGSVLRVQK